MKDINLIRKIAWSFHKSTGLDWDDLFQEAAIAYLEAMKTYNKRKGKITTHVWCCITSRLKNYLKKEREYSHPLCDIEDAYDKQQLMNFLWEKIPADLYEQINIILNNAPTLDSLLLDEQQADWVQYKNEVEGKRNARLTIRHILRTAGYDRQDVCGTIHKLEMSVKHF